MPVHEAFDASLDARVFPRRYDARVFLCYYDACVFLCYYDACTGGLVCHQGCRCRLKGAAERAAANYLWDRPMFPGLAEDQALEAAPLACKAPP